MIVGLETAFHNRIGISKSNETKLVLWKLLLDLTDDSIERLLRITLERCFAAVEDHIAFDGENECAIAILRRHARWEIELRITSARIVRVCCKRRLLIGLALQ